jgi:hypothetical protein
MWMSRSQLASADQTSRFCPVLPVKRMRQLSPEKTPRAVCHRARQTPVGDQALNFPDQPLRAQLGSSTL